LPQHNDISRVFEQVTTIINRKPNNDFAAFTQQLVFSNKHRFVVGGVGMTEVTIIQLPKRLTAKQKNLNE